MNAEQSRPISQMLATKPKASSISIWQCTIKIIALLRHRCARERVAQKQNMSDPQQLSSAPSPTLSLYALTLRGEH